MEVETKVVLEMVVIRVGQAGPCQVEVRWQACCSPPLPRAALEVEVGH